MKKKSIISVAVACALMTGFAFSGCVTTNNPNDLKQVVATVNIAENDALKQEKGLENYVSAITEEVFTKRDMMTLYATGYYSYVSVYGAEKVFDMIKDALVENAVVTQYATASLLAAKDKDSASGVTLEGYKAKEGEIEKYEYLLGGEDSEGVRKAKYQVHASLNRSLDSYEKEIITKEKEEDYVGSGTRSTPANIDSEEEDYIPEHYDVYTGYEGNLITDTEIAEAVKNGDYEQLDYSTRITRQKAYGELVKNLKKSYLITEEDESETNIDELSYVKKAYISQLQDCIVDEFNEIYTEEQEAKILKVDDGEYSFIKNRYDGKTDGELTTQEKSYATKSVFESAMDGLSDTSFILYSPDTRNDSKDGAGTYGYVYNILLPFSTAQSNILTTLQNYRNAGTIDDGEYFVTRNGLLKNIKTTDQRSAWFNGTTDYSFNAKEKEVENYFGKDMNNGREYLFFENNVTKSDKYQALDKYYGEYSYNGTVAKNKDGSYKLVPNPLDIDGMLDEFSAYIDYVLGYSGVECNKNTDYYSYKAEDYKLDDKELDYEKLVYATGKVTFKDEKTEKADMFDKETDRYKAMAAVNELQYAYTTDTGVLSQYIGYTVSAYDTSYIKEFEYAAQTAIKNGAGSFSVCAGDYGWHLIYVTDSFSPKGGEVYSADWTVAGDRINKEGTFEYRFYNWLKDSTLTKEISLKRAEILKLYNTDEAVKVNKDVYKDLSGISNN